MELQPLGAASQGPESFGSHACATCPLCRVAPPCKIVRGKAADLASHTWKRPALSVFASSRERNPRVRARVAVTCPCAGSGGSHIPVCGFQ